ncbi:bifunctional YncE family protein/alkaline phosphatase family protein [candidate division KSB1 bacterium]
MHCYFQRKCVRLSAVILLLASACGRGDELSLRPGLQPDGSVLLPNRRSLTPAGRQVRAGSLPLGAALSPDGRFLLVVNSGDFDRGVSIVDLNTDTAAASIPMEHAWGGIEFNSGGSRIYVSGGASGTVEEYTYIDGSIGHSRSISLRQESGTTGHFCAGTAVTHDDRWLIAADMLQNRVIKIDLRSPENRFSVMVGDAPYSVAVRPDNRRAFVSNWGGRSISIIDLETNTKSGKIATDGRPNDLLLSNDGATLYAACAGSDEVMVIDAVSGEITGTIKLQPFEGAPPGATPNSLTLSSDGTTLYVANADHNDVAVVDVTTGTAVIRGLIPTGFYPAALALQSDDNTLFVVNGKGSDVYGDGGEPPPYPTETERGIRGSVSIINVPAENELREYTMQVYRNNGFNSLQEEMEFGVSDIMPRVIPEKTGESSLISYVFYIISDNGFGPDSLPNLRALTDRYTLLDNFYADGISRADGHAWATAGISADYIEKLRFSGYTDNIPTTSVQVPFLREFYSGDFVWDAASRARISYRSYGEFTHYGSGNSLPARTQVIGLKGHIAAEYPPYDPLVKNITRAGAFIEEFNRFTVEERVPQLNIIYLPGGLSTGTEPDQALYSEQQADNDRALGSIVEAISHSPIWRESVIFGVLSHGGNGIYRTTPARTTALIASPFAKRGYVDHSMYTTLSVLKSIELIFGLQPLTQYDASAVPTHNAFGDTADLTPFMAQQK